MPTPTRGVPVDLDKKRHLRYPLAVLREIDNHTDIVEVLYLGLKHEDEDLTEEQVGEMIDLETLPELSDQLKKATGGMIDIQAFMGLAAEQFAGDEASAEGNAPKEAQAG